MTKVPRLTPLLDDDDATGGGRAEAEHQQPDILELVLSIDCRDQLKFDNFVGRNGI